MKPKLAAGVAQWWCVCTNFETQHDRIPRTKKNKKKHTRHPCTHAVGWPGTHLGELEVARASRLFDECNFHDAESRPIQGVTLG